MNAVDSIIKDLSLAAEKAGLTLEKRPKLEIPKSREHGDLTTNVAMEMAARAKENPRETAGRLIKAALWNKDLIEKVEIAGPGFINFFLNASFFLEGLKTVLKEGENYGRSARGEGLKTQVEFVSANPTGPLTIGHGRQAVLGDTIARFLEATGHTIEREYYFNDAGRQMRILGNSVRLRVLELLGQNIDFPDDHYQGEYIRAIAQSAIDEKGDALDTSENNSFFKDLAERAIFEDIKQTLRRLGIVFDVFYNEKSLYESGKIEDVLSILRDKDLAYDKDGAVWFKTTAFGQEQDRVIIKSSGEPTYRLPDIAYHRDKLERGFDLIVDIFGADHVATYPDVLLGLKALGYSTDGIRVLIHQFVTLKEGREKIKMSTRKANFVTLDELIDEVGEAVTRYFFINRSATAHLNFDLSLAKTESDENPVYYVQYAHARICSIIRHAAERDIEPAANADLTLLTSEEEMSLIKKVLEYPDVVDLAARDCEPHKMTTFLEEVATFYHKYQHAGKADEAMRVVTENVTLTQSRLALCQGARIVLANGLALLGISAPEKM